MLPERLIPFYEHTSSVGNYLCSFCGGTVHCTQWPHGDEKHQMNERSPIMNCLVKTVSYTRLEQHAARLVKERHNIFPSAA